MSGIVSGTTYSSMRAGAAQCLTAPAVSLSEDVNTNTEGQSILHFVRTGRTCALNSLAVISLSTRWKGCRGKIDSQGSRRKTA